MQRCQRGSSRLGNCLGVALLLLPPVFAALAELSPSQALQELQEWLSQTRPAVSSQTSSGSELTDAPEGAVDVVLSPPAIGQTLLSSRELLARQQARPSPSSSSPDSPARADQLEEIV